MTKGDRVQQVAEALIEDAECAEFFSGVSTKQVLHIAKAAVAAADETSPLKAENERLRTLVSEYIQLHRDEESMHIEDWVHADEALIGRMLAEVTPQ